MSRDPLLSDTRWGMIVVWGIIAVTCLPELVLQLSDQGLLGRPRWRAQAYQNGAFWPGLLSDWRPNFPAQPATMFLSYSGLHLGVSHLLGNMLALLFLGYALTPATLAGGLRFAGVYLGTALGAAAAFASLAHLSPLSGGGKVAQSGAGHNDSRRNSGARRPPPVDPRPV